MFYSWLTWASVHLCAQVWSIATSRAEGLIYLAEPFREGRGASKHSGFLHFIAHKGWNKTGHALDVPPTVLTQTVQRTTRVSLKEKQTETCNRKQPTFRDSSFDSDGYKVACFDASHTLQPDTVSPPAQTMLRFTLMPHQSLRLHTLCSTTGSRACCSLSGMGPCAEDRAA